MTLMYLPICLGMNSCYGVKHEIRPHCAILRLCWSDCDVNEKKCHVTLRALIVGKVLRFSP